MASIMSFFFCALAAKGYTVFLIVEKNKILERMPLIHLMEENLWLSLTRFLMKQRHQALCLISLLKIEFLWE